MAKVTTQRYEIFNYWKNKIIFPNGNIGEKCSDGFDEKVVAVVDDWVDPCCWGCGKRVFSDEHYMKIEETLDLEDEKSYKILWNYKKVKEGLERCHIKPGALGGNDEPSNLFLLCKNCHALSPDTISSQSFMRWIYNRKEKYDGGHLKLNILIELVDKDLQQRGLPSLAEMLLQVNSDFASSSLHEYMNNKIGTHGGKIAESSMVAIVADWLADEFEKSKISENKVESAVLRGTAEQENCEINFREGML